MRCAPDFCRLSLRVEPPFAIGGQIWPSWRARPLLCLRRIRFVFLTNVAFTGVFEPAGSAPLFLGGVNVLTQHGLDSVFHLLVSRLCPGYFVRVTAEDIPPALYPV